MASSKNRPNTASMLHSIAEELGCAPELVGVVKKELKLRKRDDIKHAVQERMASMAAQDEPAATPTADADTDTPKAKKERKASLTLSQRRALLKLLIADQNPATGFKALPYEHLVSVGYADRTDATDDAPASYSLTSTGRTRAESINPGYLVWSSGETVAGDESRPEAGTKRTAKAEADAEAEAEKPEPAVEEQEPVEAEIGEPVELAAATA